jgi:transcriptional regulator with XRE-family HTH domain
MNSVMTENDDIILARLPTRLKDTRRTRGLSLEALATLSGVSRSMISQIERGESSPTIATLWNLTRALQIDFGGLLDVDAKPTPIEMMRATQTPCIDDMGQLCRIRILSPPQTAGQHEVYQLDLGPDGRLDSQPHQRGAREHLTVLSGAVIVTSGGAEERLEKGDTARYAADQPHSIRATDGAASAILIVQDA